MSAVNPDPELAARYTPISSPGSQLCDPAASELEKTLADVDADRLIRIADWIIEDQWNPYRISANNLPYLAWAVGVNLWESNYWSEGTKRDWVARQWEFKARRGTPAAFKMAVEASGYRITDMMRPPQGFFAAPNMTKAEWDAWIRQMPEIRIFFAKREGTRSIDEFFCDNELGSSTDRRLTAMTGFAGQDAVPLNDGFVLRGRHAVLRHLGVDAPMHVIQYTPATAEGPAIDFERVSTIGRSTLGIFAEVMFCNDDWYVDFEEEPAKLMTLRLDREYSHDASTLALTTVEPSLDPITPRYERDSDIGDSDGMLFEQDFAADDVYADSPDGGGMLLADRVYLLDPDVVEPMTEGICFADVSRVGNPSYTAELQIDLGTTEPLNSIMEGDAFAGSNFVVEEDESHRERAFRAILAAKNLRDTILVSFAPKRPIALGDYLTRQTEADDWIAEPL